jgi:molybdopterin/thiamine biosynthesis adenylyltransferase
MATKKPDLTVIIIGAGGVASYLMPVLNKTFDLRGVIFDADILEERNLDRQIFNAEDIGDNKAQALLKICDIDQKKMLPVTEYFSFDTWRNHQGMLEKLSADFIISIADNHKARLDSMLLAEQLGIPVLIAANETSTSQAYIMQPHWVGMHGDPRVRYPELLTDDGFSPLSCQGAAQESTPQLAIANQMASSLLLWLLWLWRDDASYDHKAVEFQSTLGAIECVTIGECKKHDSRDDTTI